MCTVQNLCAVCIALNQVTTHSRPKWASELGPKNYKKKACLKCIFLIIYFYFLNRHFINYFHNNHYKCTQKKEYLLLFVGGTVIVSGK